MKFVVVVDDFIELFDLFDARHPLHNLLHALDGLRGKFSVAHLDRQNFQVCAQQINFIYILRVKILDKAAHMGGIFHQPFLLNLPQRFPNRAAADAKFLCHLLFHNSGAGLQLPGQQLHPDRLCYLLPQGLAHNFRHPAFLLFCNTISISPLISDSCKYKVHYFTIT